MKDGDNSGAAASTSTTTPTTTTTTSTTTAPKTAALVLKKNIPFLRGSSTGGDAEAINVSYWLFILEAHFLEENITVDAEKIT